MTKVIAITNQKGGVGKTTTSVSLSAALASLGQRILLIDLDPQGNATMGSGIDKNSLTDSVCELLLNRAPYRSVMKNCPEAGYDLLPSNSTLTEAEVGLVGETKSETRLKLALAPEKSTYDYIIIDCAPSLNMLTINALAAADTVLIPMQCEYYALEGLSALIGTIEGIKKNLNPALQIEGILRTMYDPRNSLTKEVSAQLNLHFPGLVYNTVIPRNIRLAEAPSHGLPIIHYDKKSRGALAYLTFAAELMRRNQNTGSSKTGTP